MSTLVELLPRTYEEDTGESAVVELQPDESRSAGATPWDLASFAEEQIRGLVRRVFLTAGPISPRQVVFCAVDREADVRPLCLSVGEALSQRTSGTACVVEALPQPTQGAAGQNGGNGSSTPKRFGVLRDCSLQLSSSLWLMPRDTFLNGNGNGFSAAWLRARLAELRLEFDYTVLLGPAAGVHSEAILLGTLSDGIVLVIEANATRRIAARRVQESLHSANARLLGTVLSERTFPIPEAIYRRL
jgi:hypothetical protein